MKDKETTREPSLIDVGTVSALARIAAIARHYIDAKIKHPYFADELLTLDGTVENLDKCLRYCRKELQEEIEYGCVASETVLDCELTGMKQAVARGDKAAAVEECYDVIAVMLRIIDVLEGRQELGRPKTAHESEAKE